MRKSLIVVSVLMIMVLSFAGCKLSSSKTDIIDEEQNQEVTNEKAGANENTEDKTPSQNGQNSTIEEEKPVESKGIYVGQIDGTSIEIKIDGEPAAYRHDEALRKVVEKLKEGEAVFFTFTKNEHGQSVLSEIKAEKTSDKIDGYVKGKYVGQIDSNSIEIIVDKDEIVDGKGTAMAFRLTEEMKGYFDSSSKQYKDFKTNDRVEFKFETNEHGQNILIDLKKL